MNMTDTYRWNRRLAYNQGCHDLVNWLISERILTGMAGISAVNHIAVLASQYSCDHKSMDDSQCLDCGKDLTQEIVAELEARADAAQDR